MKGIDDGYFLMLFSGYSRLLLILEMGFVCAIISYVSHDRSFILVARFTTLTSNLRYLNLAIAALLYTYLPCHDGDYL